MVERDQPVAEDERGVRQRGAVHERATALGLELVAEIAGEPAGEVERQLGGVGPQAGQLALAVVEHALAQLLALARTIDAEHPGRDVVAHDPAERAVGGAHEREAREPRLRARAVEPDGVVAVAVERDEDGFGVAPGRERAVVHARAGRRPGGGPRRARRPASLRVREVAEVAQQRAAVLGGDRLGVELHPPERARPVREPHHDLLGRPRRHPQGRRHRADGERVVAHGGEALRDAGEQAVPVVMDLAETPVHDRGRVVDRAAGHVRERLVAEADAEDRHLGAPEHVERDPDVAPLLRAPGAGRDHDVVHGQRRDLIPRQLVVAHDDRLVAVDLAQQVEEVEGERVVVVDQEGAHRRI